MQNTKQHILLAIPLTLTMVLAGCGGARSMPTPTSTPTDAPTATLEPSPTDTPTELPSPTPTETPSPTPTSSPTPIPLTEWTEEATVTFEVVEGVPEFSVHSFCVRGADGVEHWITLGSCEEASLPNRACPGLCRLAERPEGGGSIPLQIDGECESFNAGPAFDPVTYELGAGAQVTLSTAADTASGMRIVAKFVGAPCEESSE